MERPKPYHIIYLQNENGGGYDSRAGLYKHFEIGDKFTSREVWSFSHPMWNYIRSVKTHLRWKYAFSLAEQICFYERFFIMSKTSMNFGAGLFQLGLCERKYGTMMLPGVSAFPRYQSEPYGGFGSKIMIRNILRPNECVSSTASNYDWPLPGCEFDHNHLNYQPRNRYVEYVMHQ